MKRRDFLALAGAAAFFPRVALAQQTRVPRIALLSNPRTADQFDALYQGLAQYGYVNGKGAVIDMFLAPSDGEVPTFAAKALATKPDIVVTFGGPAAVAMKSLTTNVPVVFAQIADPIAFNLVQSYVHPGGNMTGLMQASPELVAKKIQVMREIMPALSRLAFFGQPDDPLYPVSAVQVSDAAKTLGLEVVTIEIREGGEFITPFEMVKKSAAQAVFVDAVIYFSNNVTTIAALSLQASVPAFGSVPGARGGYLFGYGPNNIDLIRRAASYVDVILKGAKAGDLPIEQPMSLDFVVNLKTAKALALNFPQSVLLRATEVIS